MISRRNIRIKVMQALYTLETVPLPEASAQKVQADDRSRLVTTGIRILNNKIQESSDLFLLMVSFLTRIALYAETDARNRSAKYLPTAEDLVVNTKIAANTVLWQILDNETFKAAVKERGISEKTDKEWIRKLYRELLVSPAYKAYTSEEGREPYAEKQILVYIWEKVMMAHAGFRQYLAEEWEAWEDDQEMMYMLLDNFFKKYQHLNFLQFISAEKRTFALSLLEVTIEKREHALELIRPRFKNWDPERVAKIDMVLLKMGVMELLYFPTIPTKVTINEYIEIAKLYSTPQSGQFVNGVLDSLLKELEQAKRIQKTERNK